MGTRENKVAPITLLFWVMKIIATTLGETFGDQLSMTLGWGYEVGIGITLVLFLLLLAWQLAAYRFHPVRFWSVIAATTTLGTELSDSLDRSLHLGYVRGSLVLATALALVLFRWHRRYHDLSVHPMVDPRKELHFWAAVLFSNSLGTAFGDMLGDVLGLSYLQGALLTGAIILLVVVLHYASRMDRVVLFWTAFVFTRPFGATFGDLLTKPADRGGLALGTLSATLVATGLLAVLVYISHRRQVRGPGRT